MEIFREKIKSTLDAGFTVFELLVDLAIIGVLAGGLIIAINPQGQFQKARDGQRKAEILTIIQALEQYRSKVGNYVILNSSTTLAPCGQALTDPNKTITYILTFPCDPLKSQQTFNNGDYVYLGSNGSGYTLIACLENANDQAGVGVAQLPTGVPTPGNCHSGTFYMVTDSTVGGGLSGNGTPSLTPQLTPLSTATPFPTNTPVPASPPPFTPKATNTR